MKYKLWVEGHPTTKGSLNWYGKGKVVNANARTKTWEQWIQWIWMKSDNYRSLKLEGVATISCKFYFKRSKSHYRTGRNSHLIKNECLHMTQPCTKRQGDLDKLCRAVFDALSGLAYTDDARICNIKETGKFWTDEEHPIEGVEIIIEGKI